MTTYLEELYNPNELKNITCKMFKRFSNANNVDALCYDDCFDYSYEVMFGDEKVDNVIYSLLKKYYKNEYFIKRSFYRRVLSNKKTITLFELPLGDSRLDIASINDKSVA